MWLFWSIHGLGAQEALPLPLSALLALDEPLLYNTDCCVFGSPQVEVSLQVILSLPVETVNFEWMIHQINNLY